MARCAVAAAVALVSLPVAVATGTTAAQRAAPASTGSVPPLSPDEVLVLEDTFDAFNLSLWKHELTLSGGGNWEFEYYTNNRSVSFVRDGALNILPGLTSGVYGTAAVQNGLDLNIWGGQPSDACTSNEFYGCERQAGGGGNDVNPIISARVRTAESFTFKYGRVEVVAKLPKGDWMWPAIWLLPSQNAYGSWPVSGEIDIVESRGNARGYPAGGVEAMSSTLHFGPTVMGTDGAQAAHASYTLPTGDFSDAFHTYGFYWNSSIMMTYVDQQPVLSVQLGPGANASSFWELGGWAQSGYENPWADSGNANAPFDQRFFLVMNVAVGGTNGYFPDGVGGKPWVDTSAHASNDFFNAAAQWLPTWPVRGAGGNVTGAGSPMQVSSVRVWQAPGSGAEYAARMML